MYQPSESMNTDVPIEEPAFETSRRTNRRPVLTGIFLGLIIIIFPTLGFLTAKEIDTQGEEPQVLGVQTQSVQIQAPSAQAQHMFTIPFVNYDVDIQVLYDNPQLLYGIGGLLGIFAILVAVALLKNTLQNRGGEEQGVPSQGQ